MNVPSIVITATGAGDDNGFAGTYVYAGTDNNGYPQWRGVEYMLWYGGTETWVISAANNDMTYPIAESLDGITFTDVTIITNTYSATPAVVVGNFCTATTLYLSPSQWTPLTGSLISFTSGALNGQAAVILTSSWGQYCVITVGPGLSAAPDVGDVCVNQAVAPALAVNAATPSQLQPAAAAALTAYGAATGAEVAAVSPVGPGGKPVVVTVENTSGDPLQGVSVWITSDLAGNTTVAGTLTTNSAGQANFLLPVGPYYVWRLKSGYAFQNPQAIAVS